MRESKWETFGCLGFVLLLLLWSALNPKGRFTLFLKVLPVLVGIPLLWGSSPSFPLTPLTYQLLTIHAVILIVGGHYTYAEVQLGIWMQDLFDFSRNHYDRLGHFAQGCVPAILTREMLLMRSPFVPGKWTFFLVRAVRLAFSASYDLFEWVSALATGEATTAFLGTQGDEWDTQWDMVWPSSEP